MPKKILPITVPLVKHIAHSLARQTMNWDEPIPAFETRYPHVLESCIVVPFQTFERHTPYKGLIEKAAIMFYLLIKNHPFQNGNKRLAVTTLLVFLATNKRWLRVDTKSFYNFAVWVAESNPEFKDEVVSAIQKFIRRSLAN